MVRGAGYECVWVSWSPAWFSCSSLNNKVSLVCVYSKPPSVSPLLLCRGLLADNKHLSTLTDRGDLQLHKRLVWGCASLQEVILSCFLLCQHVKPPAARRCSNSIWECVAEMLKECLCEAYMPNQDAVIVSMCVVCLMPLKKTRMSQC